MPTPLDTYRPRLDALRQDRELLGRRDTWLVNARLSVAIGALVVAWPTLIRQSWGWQWMLIPIALFVLLVGLHARLIRCKETCRRAIEFYEQGVRRLENDWQSSAVDSTSFVDKDHLYAADLDLFGPASLFGLLCTARTLPGQHMLARWLKEPAAIPEARVRHGAVVELSQRLDLREEFATLGEELTPRLHHEELIAWSRKPLLGLPSFIPALAAFLAIGNVLALGSWIFADADAGWLLAAFGLSAGFSTLTRRRVQAELDLGAKPVAELRLLSEFLHRIDDDTFQSSKLCELQYKSLAIRDRPSARIAHLARLIDWNESRRNQLFLPVASLLLLGTQLAVRVQHWRRENSAQIDQWLRALGEFEALTCLATLAFENPDYVFPTFRSGRPHLTARNLGHPLLPRDRRIGNDLELSGNSRWLLISGSNMSGKSTLLRSVGINTVLAFAGAPVCAEQFSVSQLAIGASIRTHDSLTEGVSRFYAEIQRLTAIRDLAANQPTLYLLDEILHGTNSHDRRIGAEGVLGELVAKPSIGLVTTHDLALTEIADRLTPKGVNVHFEDHLDGDQIAFDYTLRPGPVTRGNALALMRSLGLDV